MTKCLPLVFQKIPVPSTFYIDLWRNSLFDYDDKVIVDFLEYGWPINYTKSEFPLTTYRNHKFALFDEHHIHSYIETELSYNALVGPFSDNPFSVPLATSLLLSVPKKESSDRRTVIDLFFPPGTSVYDGIFSDSYLGEQFKLRYPSVEGLINLINIHGQGCLLYEVDIKLC